MTTLKRIAALVLPMMLALVSNPGSSHAICGNGGMEWGEECDDGNVTPGDGCSRVCTIEYCPPAPVTPCFGATRAQLLVHEKKPGKERLKLRWTKIAEATTQSDYGDPAVSTPPLGNVGRSTICIYDDLGALIQDLTVFKAGQYCPGFGPCWKATGRGYLYRDVVGYEHGVTRIQYTSGDAGKGKASAAGSNSVDRGTHIYLPVGIAAALAGNVSPTIQLVTTEGFCLGATMNAVKIDDGVVYSAHKK
jgi:cysteine-rich repeat protein